jgi:hypothetical protein
VGISCKQRAVGRCTARRQWRNSQSTQRAATMEATAQAHSL